MEIFALALVFSTFLACGTLAVLSRRPPTAARRRTEALKAEAEALPGSVLERIERIERALPAYQLEMEALAEKAHDLLDDSEKKRKRAAIHERRATGRVVAEDGPGTFQPEQPELRLVRKTGTVLEPL